jgi:hypothetical protein
MKPELSPSWVDRIFTRLQGVYGRDFTVKYSQIVMDKSGEPIDVGMTIAKKTWAQELGGFAATPDALGFALEHLPPQAPNVVEFRDICRQWKAPEPLKLGRKWSPEELTRNKQRIAELTAAIGRKRA